MDDNLSINFSFDGIFTPEVIRKFRDKRIFFNLPYQQVGELLGIHWSTIRKWEAGLTKNCNIQVRQKIEDFINGKYDESIMDMKSLLQNKRYRPHHAPSRLSHILEKLENTYRLCLNKPEICNELLNHIESIIMDILQKLIAGKSHEDFPTKKHK